MRTTHLTSWLVNTSSYIIQIRVSQLCRWGTEQESLDKYGPFINSLTSPNNREGSASYLDKFRPYTEAPPLIPPKRYGTSPSSMEQLEKIEAPCLPKENTWDRNSISGALWPTIRTYHTRISGSMRISYFSSEYMEVT